MLFIILLFSCSKTETTGGKWIKGSEKDQIKTIENQFRGMDKTMIEIGYRYQELYWGGQDENWDYTKYQINKIEKSLKLGLQRRPKRANSAQNFITYAIPEMKKAIETKEKTKFNKAFNTLRINCMSCHASENFPTFNLEIPKENNLQSKKMYFSPMKKSDRNNNLKEVALLFFKMGCVAFGGPAAHIAMMEDEVVDKRKWMTRDHFLDLMGATNLIPGPNSTELTMHCGHQRAGILGLFVAGICFIFPAVIITGILAWAYVTYGQLPEVNPYIYGIKPAVLVIIAMAIFKLSKKALKNIKLGILGGLVLVASFLGVNEITALLVAGLLGGLFFYSTRNNSLKSIALSPLLLFQGFSLKFLGSSVFWTFLKVGAILYGSGYVLFAYLDAELVATGLLSRQELVDAIAIGQLTPGPVLSTATFIGYQLNGTTGAILATLGIFLPSFLFVLLLNPLIKKMRASVFLSAFLDSVNVAAVAIMIAVLFKMGQSTLLGWREVVVLAISALLIFVFKKVNTLLIVPIGAVLGYLLTLI